MKKVLTLALAVLGFTAAQAATISWSTGSAATTGATVASATALGNTSQSVALVFNIADINAWAANSSAVLTLTHNNGGPNAYIRTDGKGASTKTENLTDAGIFKTGENVIGITATVVSNNLTYSFYVNGEMLGGATIEQKGAAHPYLQNIVFGSMIGSDAKYYTALGVATKEDFAAVPEPTALALLALGVAGLALKRKVA